MKNIFVVVDGVGSVYYTTDEYEKACLYAGYMINEYGYEYDDMQILTEMSDIINALEEEVNDKETVIEILKFISE